METETKIKTSHKILEDFSKVRNLHSSYKPSQTRTTPRMDFIIQTLDEMGLEYEVDVFKEVNSYSTYLVNKDKMKRLRKDNKIRIFLEKSISKYKTETIDLDLVKYMNMGSIRMGAEPIDMVKLRRYLIFNKTEKAGYYGNIIVRFKAKEETDDTIMFTAHHDVSNVNSDNCIDNSASVCNLLKFAEELKDKELDKNIYIVFTDGEEYGGKGARYLSERIHKGEFGQFVEYIVNLEITARGKNYWAERQMSDSNLLDKIRNMSVGRENKVFAEHGVPFNDSIIFRRFNIDSVCIGSITDKDVKALETKYFCETWGMCHSSNDSFSLAVEEDMSEFVELLHKFI